MRLIIFDTETTGLPKTRDSAFKGPDNWPHLVSISWVILDTDENTIQKQRDYIIYPDSWVIPEESTKIHGISHADAVAKGKDLFSVMIEFNSEQFDGMMAHNLHFDENVLINAYKWDLKIMDFAGFTCQKFCSMTESRTLCKLPTISKTGYKLPKLKELYYHVFGRYPNEKSLHSSMFDTLVLTQCIQHSNDLRLAIGLPRINTIYSNGLLKNTSTTK